MNRRNYVSLITTRYGYAVHLASIRGGLKVRHFETLPAASRAISRGSSAARTRTNPMKHLALLPLVLILALGACVSDRRYVFDAEGHGAVRAHVEVTKSLPPKVSGTLTALGADTSLRLVVRDPDGKVLLDKTFTLQADKAVTFGERAPPAEGPTP
jgi:hypothetical protein